MIDILPDFVLRFLMRLGDIWPWFGRKLNSFAINGLVNSSRHRPHPWSTVHPYISWTSLTDQHYSARHLPAKPNPAPIDPVILADLFRQRSGKQILSDKSTCLFPAFAQYLTDGFIRTRMPDTSIGETDEVRKQNTSNHQIDLCPLYGRLPKQTDALRLKSDAKKGRLKSQIFNGEEYALFLYDGDDIKAEFNELDEPLGLERVLKITPDPAELKSRIFAFGGDRANASPQVAMMNNLFLREHNRLAGEIESAYPVWDDERVFQTARNALIALFIKVVVEEYINHISPSVQFQADASVAWNAPWNKPNWMTTEFSLLYRWHSLIPAAITWNGMPRPLRETLMNNQLLLNGGLAAAFSEMSAQTAGRLGGFNTAEDLVHLEIDAIKQGQLCELASYGDYREYVSLPRPRDFSDISTDSEVVDLLKKTYKSVDDIDFYVGLFAENAIKNSPLPPLMLRLVAVDAFSQALTNPLLSEHVFNPGTFSGPGWKAINETKTLRDIVARNTAPGAAADMRISMTLHGWKPAM